MRLQLFLYTLFLVVSPCLSQDIAVTGTIKDTDGKVIQNALIRFENLGYVTVSSTEGGFILSNNSPIQPRQKQGQTFDNIRIEQGTLCFSVKDNEQVNFAVHSLRGQLCVQKQVSGIAAGSYNVELRGLIPSQLSSGTYIVSLQIGNKKAAGQVIHRSGDRSIFNLRPIDGAMPLRLARQQSSIDLITISKLGYVSQSVEIESYQQDLGVIILQKSSLLEGANAIAHVEDSLVSLFINRIQSIENLEGPDELKSIDFISIRNGFEAILAINNGRVKSNIGYMLSAIASLNTNPKIWKIADSLDAYFDTHPDAVEPISGSSTEGMQLMKRAMKKGGVLTLGKALAAKTPEMLLSSTQEPSFPKFLTIGYIQTLIETDLIPILAPIQEAAARVEALPDASMSVTVDGDEYDIDKGEVYLFDAYVHLMKAYMYMYCAYDFDLYTAPGQQDYSWIDTLVNNDFNSKRIYTLSHDTLYEIQTWQGEKKSIQTMAGVFHYNIEQRSSFMTIRRPYHSAALNCLQAVPVKIKSGLAAIKVETDDQENDLLQISMIDSANGDMLDLSGEMRDEGFSTSFADNFSSIDKLMDFITKLLNGPYTFDETIDAKQVTVTVDLPSWFTNPVTDLRSLLPHYTWTNEAEWVKPDTGSSWSQNFYTQRIYNPATGQYDSARIIYVYEGDEAEVKINPSLIDSVVTDEWGDQKYYIGAPIQYQVYLDSSYYFDALRLTDENGAVISNETIDSLIDNKTFFPYFDDYTFHGLFPAMTRGKWLDFIYSVE